MKTVPSALQAHLDTGTTSLCFLLKIVPQKADAFGVTTLDVDLPYDDGDGGMTYESIPGMNLSAVETAAGLEVANSEATLLISTDFTAEEIAAGILDYANFFVYRVNWRNTGDGHYMVQSGRTGIVRSTDQLSGIIELRGIAQQLKQNYIDLYSITCRATFGSDYNDEQFPCLFDAEPLWQANTVAAVGTEPDYQFTLTTIPSATGPNGALPFDYALIEFLTGRNAGLTVETEVVSGLSVELRFQTAYPVEVGDTLQMRPDCQKRYEDDCISLYDNGDMFRGEPWIPLTEESPSQYPGANVPGLGAPTYVPPTPVDPITPVPIPPGNSPDLTGAVSWDSVFGVPFGSSISREAFVAPSAGIAIWFLVPNTADAFELNFYNVDVNHAIPTTVTGAINTTVLDFTTAPVYTWGTGGGISGGINYGGTDISLVPNNIYILNLRNNTVNDPNWIDFACAVYPR